VFLYPGCRGGRTVADVVRLDKGHTEGLEPQVTQKLIQLMLAAPGGQLRAEQAFSPVAALSFHLRGEPRGAMKPLVCARAGPYGSSVTQLSAAVSRKVTLYRRAKALNVCNAAENSRIARKTLVNSFCSICASQHNSVNPLHVPGAFQSLALDDADGGCQRSLAARLHGGRIVPVSAGAVADAPSKCDPWPASALDARRVGCSEDLSADGRAIKPERPSIKL
jgi:hypothetical protein